MIYDGAHACGGTYKGESIFNFGDITTCSTHATKLFHTVEGGFVVSKNKNLMKRIAFMRNFGHNGPYDYSEVGINGKNSELHAAVGLVNLKHFQKIYTQRKSICEAYYDSLLRDNIFLQNWNKYSKNNYSYFPVLLSQVVNVEELLIFLNNNNIFPRRYFYPSLSSVELFSKKEKTPVSSKVSKHIICLPLYVGLEPAFVINNLNSFVL